MGELTTFSIFETVISLRSETERGEERVVKNFLSFWKVKRGTWNVVLFFFLFFSERKPSLLSYRNTILSKRNKNAPRAIFCK